MFDCKSSGPPPCSSSQRSNLSVDVSQTEWPDSEAPPGSATSEGTEDSAMSGILTGKFTFGEILLCVCSCN